MKKITQEERILVHMLRAPKTGITTMDAFNKYGITRLSGRIFDLKAKGVPIASIKGVTVLNRYGEETQVTRYIVTDKEAARKILERMRAA